MATKNLQYESGRSMVEMLGTLAIIGVLSIGGIAGYKYGMDKYKANQTVNDVMLMGVDIITQLSQNRDTPTLSSDWGTKTTAGYDFTVVQNPEDATQYGIQITGVPASICKQVGDGLKQTVAVYVGNEDYNSDTETDPCDESDSNTMEFYFETAFYEECKTDSDCQTDQFCLNGLCNFKQDIVVTGGITDKSCSTTADCQPCGYCINQKCGYDTAENGQSCTIDGQDGQCAKGECVIKGCDDSTPCKGRNEYCASPNNSNAERFKEGEKGSCITAEFLPPITVDGKKYYISKTNLSWWDAESACKAIGKTMVQQSDLVNEADENYVGTGTYCYSRTNLAEQLFKQYPVFSFYSIWIVETTKEQCSNTLSVDLERACTLCGFSKNSKASAYAVCK
ncbi:MAG: hypothetical protein IJV75_06060 [Alphaproteobacteria bacterium]|nr:hypothetical protein [Alphaproteobacteria bacterium]